jgi:hypothetical protein
LTVFAIDYRLIADYYVVLKAPYISHPRAPTILEGKHGEKGENSTG